MSVFCNKCEKINNDTLQFCDKCNNRLQISSVSEKSYSVMISDMSHYMDKKDEYIINGFPTEEQAIKFARNLVRKSLEELRKSGQTKKELRQLWYLYGEDAVVIGANYSGSSELDFFIDNLY